MLRNIRNFRNLFSLRGVINSDIPMVSRFVIPPPARGVAFRDGALGSIPNWGGCIVKPVH